MCDNAAAAKSLISEKTLVRAPVKDLARMQEGWRFDSHFFELERSDAHDRARKALGIVDPDDEC